jgi:hypothetical protein
LPSGWIKRFEAAVDRMGAQNLNAQRISRFKSDSSCGSKVESKQPLARPVERLLAGNT